VRKAELKTRDSGWWNTELLDVLPIPLMVFDKRFVIRYANEAWCRQTNTSKDALLGKAARKEYGREITALVGDDISQLKKEREISGKELSSIKKLPWAATYGLYPIKDNRTVAGAALAAFPVTVLNRDTKALGEILNGDIVFGKLLSRVRKSREMHVTELARKSNLARGYVSIVESGRIIPSFNAMISLSQILDPDGKENLFLAGVISRIPPEMRHLLPWWKPAE